MEPHIDHIQHLAARKSKAYELLLALEQTPQANESCFQSLAHIVDRIVFHEISLSGGVLEGLNGFVKEEGQGLESALAVLSLAMSEAEPERGNIQVLLAAYPKWLRTVSVTARPHFLGILPNIAPLLTEMESSGVETLIACLNTCASAEDCEIMAGCAGRYQETSGSILIAAAEIAAVAIRTGSQPLVGKLVTAIDPEAMLDSKPARELLPALVKLRTAAGSEPVWAAAIGVCIAVAGENLSSALHLARHLQTSLTPQTPLAYLKSFQRIVEEVGPSLAGYGTKQLPVLFQKAGEERAVHFVEQGIAIARRYGRVAAEEFFEQTTAAAKQASPLG